MLSTLRMRKLRPQEVKDTVHLTHLGSSAAQNQKQGSETITTGALNSLVLELLVLSYLVYDKYQETSFDHGQVAT